ncbi:MAG: hypothetical protein ACXW2X_01690, partial [Thermoanaerobaculia bacterium]
MTKMLKGFAVGLLIVIAAMAPACRSTKKKDTKTTSTATTATVSEVPVTATTEMKVDTQPADFVQTDTAPKPTVEVLPADVEQLNRTAQDRGYIRDTFFGYDEATLNADAQAALSASATWLKQNPRYNILIEGHTDERG